jgi:hypothetical protein
VDGQPPQVAVYSKAIKVTVDGPREPRGKPSLLASSFPGNELANSLEEEEAQEGQGCGGGGGGGGDGGGGRDSPHSSAGTGSPQQLLESVPSAVPDQHTFGVAVSHHQQRFYQQKVGK